MWRTVYCNKHLPWKTSYKLYFDVCILPLRKTCCVTRGLVAVVTCSKGSGDTWVDAGYVIAMGLPVDRLSLALACV